MSTLAKPSAPNCAREGVLLACPPVFSYHLSIRRELEALGFDVTWWNDRASDSSFYKVGLRLLPDAVAERSTPIFMRQLDSLDPSSITRVLIVKGEGMSTRFLESLRRRLPGMHPFHSSIRRNVIGSSSTWWPSISLDC